jgi:hypothetical protein
MRSRRFARKIDMSPHVGRLVQSFPERQRGEGNTVARAPRNAFST